MSTLTFAEYEFPKQTCGDGHKGTYYDQCEVDKAIVALRQQLEQMTRLKTEALAAWNVACDEADQLRQQLGRQITDYQRECQLTTELRQQLAEATCGEALCGHDHSNQYWELRANKAEQQLADETRVRLTREQWVGELEKANAEIKSEVMAWVEELTEQVLYPMNEGEMNPVKMDVCLAQLVQAVEAITPAALTLAWTTEQPTVPGWYWWRRDKFLFVRKVHFCDEQGWTDGYTVEKLTEAEAQWAGPIELPHSS